MAIARARDGEFGRVINVTPELKRGVKYYNLCVRHGMPEDDAALAAAALLVGTQNPKVAPLTAARALQRVRMAFGKARIERRDEYAAAVLAIDAVALPMARRRVRSASE